VESPHTALAVEDLERKARPEGARPDCLNKISKILYLIMKEKAVIDRLFCAYICHIQRLAYQLYLKRIE